MIIPSYNDVVFGRGYTIINRPGNKWYRSLIINRKSLYDSAASANEKKLKQKYADEVVDIIYRHGGRFLTKRKNAAGHSLWIEVPRKQAIFKARPVEEY